jgi:signal transduction histidine kinase
LGFFGGRVERALQLAERNIVRCDNIINELLDYTRDRVLQRSPTHIDAWLSKMLDEQVIPENVTCIRELDADKDAVDVWIDSEHLRCAIINVVNDALDAMREVEPVNDGHRLMASTQIVDDRLEVQISDTGCGIPDENMDRIFEPLFSTKSFGVGLGLPIVKGIMEQHGIEISSQAGEGTAVVLWLPTPDRSNS